MLIEYGGIRRVLASAVEGYMYECSIKVGGVPITMRLSGATKRSIEKQIKWWSSHEEELLKLFQSKINANESPTSTEGPYKKC